jgi:hypothetical protein
MFQSLSSTIFRGSSAVLCAVTIPPADLRSLGFVLLHSVRLHVYVICVCLVFLSVGDLLVNCFVMCVGVVARQYTWHLVILSIRKQRVRHDDIHGIVYLFFPKSAQ